MTQLRNKQRLIRLFKYLYRETDEDHPVTTNYQRTGGDFYGGQRQCCPEDGERRH